MSGRETFRKYRGYIKLLEKFWCLFPYSIRLKLFVHFRDVKGIRGIVIRYTLLATLAKKIGDNVSVQPNVYLLHPQYLELGDNVSIHPFSYIDSVGGVTIGNNVSIAEGTSIFSFNHNYEERTVPIKYQGITKKAVYIDSDIWIGAKATILAGVTIGTGSVVAAGAVVTKDVEPLSIVAGVPAALIKSR